MTRILTGLLLFLALGAETVVYSQRATVDPFNGTWKINLEKTQQFTGEKPKYEVITLTVKDDIQDYKVDYEIGNNPRSKMGYTTKYNEIKWVPYMNYTTGQKNMDVMTIKVDDRTHYRVIRRNDGTSGGIMMRRMAEDLKSYVAIDLDVNGKTNYMRVFEKQ